MQDHRWGSKIVYSVINRGPIRGYGNNSLEQALMY